MIKMGDREKMIKSLRRELEGWREALIGLHSVFIWEKQFYPAITASVISLLFLLIWYIDPAVLTLLSFIGIVITLSDFFVPQIMPWIYGPNHWTGVHERKYEQIIVSLAGMYEMFSNFASSLHSVKSSKPKTFFVMVTTFLVMSAWIGSSVNNLFLTYFIVLVAALFPGLRKQDIVKKYFAFVMQNLSKILKGTSSSTAEASEEKSTKKE